MIWWDDWGEIRNTYIYDFCFVYIYTKALETKSFQVENKRNKYFFIIILNVFCIIVCCVSVCFFFFERIISFYLL